MLYSKYREVSRYSACVVTRCTVREGSRYSARVVTCCTVRPDPQKKSVSGVAAG